MRIRVNPFCKTGLSCYSGLMNKPTAALSVLVLSSLSLVVAAPQPTQGAAALKILSQDGQFCYSAEVTVNDTLDAALSQQAEATMVKTFTGLGLNAVQYDQAANCDRELIYTFGIDVAGAPSLYNDDLKLHSYVASDGDVQLDSVTVWSQGYWGGDAKVWSKATYTKKMVDNLVTMMAQFTADYRSLSK